MADRNGGNANHRFEVKLTRKELEYIEKLLKSKVDQMAAECLIHTTDAKIRAGG